MFGFGTTPNAKEVHAKEIHAKEQHAKEQHAKEHHHSHEHKSHNHHHKHNHHHHDPSPQAATPMGACGDKDERPYHSTHDLSRHNTKKTCNKLNPHAQHERLSPHDAQQERTGPHHMPEGRRVSDDHDNEVLLELAKFKAKFEDSCSTMHGLLKAKLEELEMERIAMWKQEELHNEYVRQTDQALAEIKARFEAVERYALSCTPRTPQSEKLYVDLEDWRGKYYQTAEFIEKGHRDISAACGRQFNPYRY